MTRDEIINGLEREVKSIRREPQSKMLGICIAVDEAEDILALLKEQEDLKQKMCNALYAEEDKLEKKFIGTEEHDAWFFVYRHWLQRGFEIVIKVFAEQDGM